jgi:hypothetical protein
MNEQLKKRLIEVLWDDMEGCFDVRDYIRYGGNFKGLYNMTDKELLEEYESYVSDDDELLAEVRVELAVNDMLKS